MLEKLESGGIPGKPVGNRLEYGLKESGTDPGGAGGRCGKGVVGNFCPVFVDEVLFELFAELLLLMPIGGGKNSGGGSGGPDVAAATVVGVDWRVGELDTDEAAAINAAML